jgi:DNA polymerase elongation subunit (family B)
MLNTNTEDTGGADNDKHIFLYSFTVQKNEMSTTERHEQTMMRLYGVDNRGETVCLRFNNFRPYVYIELPMETKWGKPIKWNIRLAKKVKNALDDALTWPDANNRDKKICLAPVEVTFDFYKKLYSQQVTYSGAPNKFPFLRCAFNLRSDINMLVRKCSKPMAVSGLGALQLKVHENNADEILQLSCVQDIPTAGWVDFKGRLVSPKMQQTSADREYKVESYTHITRRPGMSGKTGVVKVLSFDLEVNSSIVTRMPDSKDPADKVFQISCVFFGSDNPAKTTEFLLTLGDPMEEIVGENVKIIRRKTEAQLIESFAELVRTEKPNIITGYNILKFDIPYLIDRSELCRCARDLALAGFHKDIEGQKKIVRWSTAAYKNQEFEYLEWEGRVIVDMLPIIKRDYKMNNYKLETVCMHFFDTGKDPLDHKGIFDCYRKGIVRQPDGTYLPEARKAMSVVGKYCMVDSRLVAKLFGKAQTWFGLVEMACVCNVPIFALVVRGQQLKVFSSIYKHCYKEKIVVESDGYKAAAGERYKGAHVFAPVPGVYDNIVPFDFASLYPTTIIAYNIDFSTLVTNNSIPDRFCHVCKWDDHEGCEHDPRVIRKQQLDKYIDSELVEIKRMRTKRDNLTIKQFLPPGRASAIARKGAKKLRERKRKSINRKIDKRIADLKVYREERIEVKKGIPKKTMCASRKYRFLKKPKGVIPTVLQNTLDARAKTRKKIKELKKTIKESGDPDGSLSLLVAVYHQKQLAFKVSANSMYGAMGVVEGYLPFMPGAMCTTAMGRYNNKLAAKTIVDKWKGKLIYGDSVTGDTPVMIKHANGMVDVVTIETLVNGDYEPYDQFKAGQSNRREKQQAKVDVQVWADGVWADVNRVIRHKTKKRIFRVLTHTGCVDVTEDHSLLDATGQKLKPVDAKIGQELLHAFPTEFYSDCKEISTEEAFVMGFFFGDGSCGDYACPSGRKCSWALNNSNIEYLNEAQQCLQKCEPSLGWKVLDTIKSSGVYKLVPQGPQGNVKYIVEKYRPLFYDKDKFKKVPMCILNAPVEVRAEFVRGYRVADGTKMGPRRADCKGKIGCQGLYYLFCSLGENVSINTRESKPDVFRLNSTHGKFRKSPSAIKKIIDLGYNDEDEFVYDIETTQGRFFGGIGRLILKNTDSEYIYFPHITGKNNAEFASNLWSYCEKVAADVTKLYPPPMKLEFEEVIYHRFIILSKKRYMYREMNQHGEISAKVGNKGVLLSRRDNSDVVRELYSGIADQIFNRVKTPVILDWTADQVRKLFEQQVDIDKYVITKSVGSVGDLPLAVNFTECGSWRPQYNEDGKAVIGNYTITPLSKDPVERQRQLHLKNASTEVEYYGNSVPSHVSLAIRMRGRGTRVEPGSRLEYVVTQNGGHTGKMFHKIEDIDYARRHSDHVRLDMLYYLKQMVNPVDQLLNACCKTKDAKNFMMMMYKHNLKKHKLTKAIAPPPKICFAR